MDRALAILYGIETRALKQAVHRKAERFPEDFMLPLAEEEVGAMVSPNVILNKSVLGGAIMSAFVQLRSIMTNNQELAAKIDALEERYDEQFAFVFEAIKSLLGAEENSPGSNKSSMGFHL